MNGQIFLDFIKECKCPLTWLSNVSMHKLRPGVESTQMIYAPCD